MIRETRRAFGTDVTLILDAEDGAATMMAAWGEIARLEARFSRFDPDSELMRLNRARDGVASLELRRVVETALHLGEATGGRFDVRVHDAMIRAGYDRTFSAVPDCAGPAGDPAPARGTVRLEGERIRLDGGAQIDLGGIAKGWTAEYVADRLAVAGPCLVSMGGDIAVRGLCDGAPWPVSIPRGHDAATLALVDVGLATSGTARRRWRRGDREMHHVMDPVRGAVAQTDLAQASVVAHDAATAEAWATALLVAGWDAAPDLARAAGVAAVLVADDGRVRDVGVGA